MMRSTIATYKENLSQIALDVQDAAEELEIYRSAAGEDASVADRRISHRFAQSKSPQWSPFPNGVDSGFKAEIEQYKAEIQRLQTSEAEIKALSVNYAAILKEKEEELSRLNEENGLLRKNLAATNAVGYASRNESLRTSINNSSVHKGTGDKSPSRQQRHTTQASSRHIGNHTQKGILPKQDAFSNGSVEATQSDGVQRKMELKLVNLQGGEKEFADILEENRALAAIRADHELEIKQLRAQLEKEHENLANTMLKLQGESKLNESSQKELHMLKMDKDKTSMEMKELRIELNDKVSEMERLQSELNRRELEEETEEPAKSSLKTVIATLEKENANLKAHASENLLGKEDMSQSVLSLTKALKDACRERDKALQELARLKQHLLDKELEESDKMDEDSKIIEELRANSEHQKAQILRLEKSLKQAISSQEEIKRVNSDEIQKLNEIINDLKNKLASCTSIIDSKNIELLNLQTALGQYYAESEAKERLGRDLAVAREETAKLSELLKDANQRMEISKREKEELLAKLSHAERLLLEGKHTVQKVEEDNLKLRRGLEQSMTRLSRMSMDSDYFVDRRIVIKLLVTYFQRNHSKEVLDLMVRMLGFSEEDKKRIGFAQQVAGKGVVRGVLGLPGRLVGGILGGGSSDVSAAHGPSENQSFADLWVDFLLKETEERERRVTAEAGGAPERTPEQWTSNPSSGSSYLRVSSPANQIPSPLSMRGNQLSEQLDTEFSTVPLTSSASLLPENSSRASRLLPRY
ncbi:golgin candidate 4 isoform X2 [Magnolia sinica]|uniref:golgin candidate 4 isoform X2 n=1 Tax=Magnolia sinica TaxID=86752 RepID=UPI002657BB92|nr:golgin candidate 4 isoform X2 [Magnolia sinica]